MISVVAAKVCFFSGFDTSKKKGSKKTAERVHGCNISRDDQHEDVFKRVDTQAGGAGLHGNPEVVLHPWDVFC